MTYWLDRRGELYRIEDLSPGVHVWWYAGPVAGWLCLDETEGYQGKNPIDVARTGCLTQITEAQANHR